jgi:hypothetical protein
VEYDPGLAQKKPRRRRRAVALVIVFAVVGIAIWQRPDDSPESNAQVQRVVPVGTRIKIEVLNATDSRGLARTATFYLRDAGFDVVYFGNTNERHDSTVVRDRSGHSDWAELARVAMAPASVEVKPDSGRLVDLTVLIGARWRPPTEPFRP